MLACLPIRRRVNFVTCSLFGGDIWRVGFLAEFFKHFVMWPPFGSMILCFSQSASGRGGVQICHVLPLDYMRRHFSLIAYLVECKFRNVLSVKWCTTCFFGLATYSGVVLNLLCASYLREREVPCRPVCLSATFLIQ